MSEENKGPFLIMASFCENGLQEKDGILSAIRLIDTLEFTVEGEHAPVDIPPITVRTCLIMRFASQHYSASHELRVIGVRPDGAESKVLSAPISFAAGGLGFNFRLILNLGLTHTGVYWFRVYLDEELFGQVPLRVLYQRSEGGESEKASNSTT